MSSGCDRASEEVWQGAHHNLGLLVNVTAPGETHHMDGKVGRESR
jgi:hypothetical protein